MVGLRKGERGGARETWPLKRAGQLRRTPPPWGGARAGRLQELRREGGRSWLAGRRAGRSTCGGRRWARRPADGRRRREAWAGRRARDVGLAAEPEGTPTRSPLPGDGAERAGRGAV